MAKRTFPVHWVGYWKILPVLAMSLILSCASGKVREKGGSDLSMAREPASGVVDSVAFTLCPADKVKINVWRNSELSGTVQIDPSGNIQFPLIGEVRASGLTIGQLRDEIELRLTRYLVNPKVDINVSSLGGQQAYVLGEVQNPGALTLNRNMLVWEAIVNAGGFTEDANRRKAVLVRHGQDGTVVMVLGTRIMRNSRKKRGKMMLLKRGDIVYVPRSVIAGVESFMTRFGTIIEPIINVERGISIWPQVIDALEAEDDEGDIILVAP